MKIGILGYGTMGASIAQGLAAAGVEARIAAYDKLEERRSEAARNGVSVAPSPEALVEGSEVLLVAVKPQDLSRLLQVIGRKCADRRIVSIVAGRSIAGFEAACGTREVARLMPTIAATVRQSYVGVSFHEGASPALREAALAIARSVGTAVELPERLLAAVTGLAGSGIAFVFAFLHAMAMGGVHAGMDYRRALEAAMQATRGALALLEGGEHGSPASPMDLVTRVTSPAGTTIEGISRLEQGSFTAAVMGAVKAAADRAVELERDAG
jgi:pyrroline-5-carboxylate reductase